MIEERAKWIPCSKRMPEEHDSIFAKLKGTDKWKTGMFEKRSDDVNVTVEFSTGRIVRTAHTTDGKWILDILKMHPEAKIVAWMPLPESYRGE